MSSKWVQSAVDQAYEDATRSLQRIGKELAFDIVCHGCHRWFIDGLLGEEAETRAEAEVAAQVRGWRFDGRWKLCDQCGKKWRKRLSHWVLTGSGERAFNIAFAILIACDALVLSHGFAKLIMWFIWR